MFSDAIKGKYELVMFANTEVKKQNFHHYGKLFNHECTVNVGHIYNKKKYWVSK